MAVSAAEREHRPDAADAALRPLPEDCRYAGGAGGAYFEDDDAFAAAAAQTMDSDDEVAAAVAAEAAEVTAAAQQWQVWLNDKRDAHSCNSRACEATIRPSKCSFGQCRHCNFPRHLQSLSGAQRGHVDTSLYRSRRLQLVLWTLALACPEGSCLQTRTRLDASHNSPGV